jgi:1-acyl-sn-glycerol-3-phosphate acyltransferase
MLRLRNPDLLENRNADLIRTTHAALRRTIWPYHRAEVRGLDRIPEQHRVIYVGNHNGFPYMTEAFLFTSALFGRFGMSRFPYTLMHDLPLKLPVTNQFFTGYGCLRASQDNAKLALERDQSLLIYPGGDAELMRPHRERTRLRFQGRNGHIRLALKYNTPIVPVVAVGGHSTARILDDLRWLAEAIGAKRALRIGAWPLMLSVPWGLTLGPFIPPYLPWPSRIIVEVLDPIVFPSATSAAANEKTWAEQCAQRLERTMEDALERLEAERVGKPRPVDHEDRAPRPRDPRTVVPSNALPSKRPRSNLLPINVPPTDPQPLPINVLPRDPQPSTVPATQIQQLRHRLGDFFQQQGRNLDGLRKRFAAPDTGATGS